MRTIRTEDGNFEPEFRRIKGRGRVLDRGLEAEVRRIIDDVAARGDEALFEYIRRFDRLSLDSRSLVVSADEMQQALEDLDPATRDILETAAGRIEDFHKRQLVGSWSYGGEDGVELGQLIVPLERVGVYAPGGLASYPSTVLMATIPARVAGVCEIYLATPSAKGGGVDRLILAAAGLGGVQCLYRMGGAQAVAAFAYGTQTVPYVDKIVGPGNAYVAMAKRMVYGAVGIDMIAGPSEVMIVCDGNADPSWIAADLVAQAEHDEMASAILLTPAESFALAVSEEVERQLNTLVRGAIARRAIDEYGAVFVTESLKEAVEIVNRFAPEHLELVVDRPKNLLKGIRNAGAVFLGPLTPEAFGDYLAGPNHILPTGGTARFSSPLGVHDFIKRTNIISFSRSSFNMFGDKAVAFAGLEGLEGHGNSVMVRKGKKS
ncbi:MAG: histidinol dehydrogenase [Syntrophobacterales bacterium]|nr:histidinol dehydrogenase [Syntrophobacterales bacterium]